MSTFFLYDKCTCKQRCLNLYSVKDFSKPIGDANINPVTSVRNLDVVFDKHMTTVPQVNSVCRSAYMHIRNIGCIRRFLLVDAIKSLMHSVVTSRLEYCNGLLINYNGYRTWEQELSQELDGMVKLLLF